MYWAEQRLSVAARGYWEVGGSALAGGASTVIAEIAADRHRRVETIVNVEELKAHIHKELFGDRFPSVPPIMEWKEKRKETVMAHSVHIMRRHERSDAEIIQMLEEKFFLTEEQAHEFLQHENSKEQEKGE